MAAEGRAEGLLCQGGGAAFQSLQVLGPALALSVEFPILWSCPGCWLHGQLMPAVFQPGAGCSSAEAEVAKALMLSVVLRQG